MKTCIHITTLYNNTTELWATLADFCKAKGLKARTFYNKQMPFEYYGMRFERKEILRHDKSHALTNK